MEADKVLPVVITDKEEMRKWSRSMRLKGKTIALVPTMGYLHEGHLQLIKEAQSHAEAIVVSIYVNPGQFSPNEDLSTYPSDFHGDLEKLAGVPWRVDAVFHPRDLYVRGRGGGGDVAGRDGKVVVSCVEEGSGSGHETWVRVERLEKGMCGRSRPVFFRGVATVVTKLFNIVEPDVAVFGKKDYQQWRIIQRMVRDLEFPIQIIGSEIVRESDGLALSSRNVRLTAEEREKAMFCLLIAISSHLSEALSISISLLQAKSSAEGGQKNCGDLKNMVTQAITKVGGVVDYAEMVDRDDLETLEELNRPAVFCVAAWFGKVRLIDNVEITV